MTATLNVKAIAQRFHEERKRRGISLETAALQMDLSLRTVQKLDEAGRGLPSDWNPSGSTMNALIEWLEAETPNHLPYDGETIDRICDLVRESNLDLVSGQSVIAAFRSLWNLAQIRRPLAGNDDDARDLLEALAINGNPLPAEEARAGAQLPEGDRFVTARAVLIAARLIHPNEAVLSLTADGRETARSLGIGN